MVDALDYYGYHGTTRVTWSTVVAVISETGKYH